MAVGTIVGLASTGKELFSGVKSLFGGGKEPNAGSSSLIDALDNYESISSSNARAIVDEFTQRIARGESDYQLASFLASQGGEPGKGAAYKSSWKWDIVQRWIDRTRQMQADQRSQQASQPFNQTSQTGSSGAMGSAARMGSPFFVIILIIISVFYFQMQGK